MDPLRPAIQPTPENHRNVRPRSSPANRQLGEFPPQRTRSTSPPPPLSLCALGQTRHSQCNDCRRISDARRASKRQSQAFEAAINFASRQPTYSRAAMAVEVMVHRIGGMRQFCDLWHSELHAAMSKRPGSRLASRSFTLIAQVIAHNSSHQAALEKEEAEKRQHELHRMSDEELEAQLNEQLEAVAGRMLRGAGYEV